MRDGPGRDGCVRPGVEHGSAAPVSVRYSEVRVPLVGEDGNAFAILGRVQKALRRAGVEPEEIQRFIREATADDYDHPLQTVMAWVATEEEER